MTTLETVRGQLFNGTMIKKQHLLLAYIQLHREEPALHPDGYLCLDSGYAGWHAVLVHTLFTTYDCFPDGLQYPNSFHPMKLDPMLEELRDFHQDCMEDNEQDSVYHLDQVARLNDIIYWLEDMKPSELDGIIDAFQKLYLYHACENDTVDEESEKPAGTLKECADILNWILTQN